LQSLSPEDKFFAVLEANLENYINDRPAAYEFIVGQLRSFKGKSPHDISNSYILEATSVSESERTHAHLQLLQHQNDILKKGIRI
jgi:hypothetical protein